MGRKKEGKEYDILVAKKEAGSKHCRFYKQSTMFWVTRILLAVYMIQSNLCECTLWSLCCDWAHLSCLSQSNSYGLYFLSQRLFNKHPSVWFANTFPSHTQLPNEQWFLRFAPENWKICLAALSFGALSLDPGADGSTTNWVWNYSFFDRN